MSQSMLSINSCLALARRKATLRQQPLSWKMCRRKSRWIPSAACLVLELDRWSLKKSLLKQAQAGQPDSEMEPRVQRLQGPSACITKGEALK